METCEFTVALVKPDAEEDGYREPIIRTYTRESGVIVVLSRELTPTREMAELHYDKSLAERTSEEIRELNVQFLMSGPVYVMVLQGNFGLIEWVREKNGDTEPASAAPGTIRKLYAHGMSYADADVRKCAIRNAVHASDSPESVVREALIYFTRGDLMRVGMQLPEES